MLLSRVLAVLLRGPCSILVLQVCRQLLLLEGLLLVLGVVLLSVRLLPQRMGLMSPMLDGTIVVLLQQCPVED